MKKYCLEILTFITFAMVTGCAIFYDSMTILQKTMLAYMFLFTIHEWEEIRLPGGFAQLMAKFFGFELTPEKEQKAHIPVAVLILFMTFVPFFTQWKVLALVPIYLGLMEGFIHVAGIKIHKMPKPYTPGMFTALVMFSISIYVLHLFSTQDIIQGNTYGWGVLATFLCFAAMQRTVIAIMGMGYRDVLARFHKKS